MATASSFMALMEKILGLATDIADLQQKTTQLKEETDQGRRAYMAAAHSLCNAAANALKFTLRGIGVEAVLWGEPHLPADGGESLTETESKWSGEQLQIVEGLFKKAKDYFEQYEQGCQADTTQVNSIDYKARCARVEEKRISIRGRKELLDDRLEGMNFDGLSIVLALKRMARGLLSGTYEDLCLANGKQPPAQPLLTQKETGILQQDPEQFGRYIEAEDPDLAAAMMMDLLYSDPMATLCSLMGVESPDCNAADPQSKRKSMFEEVADEMSERFDVGSPGTSMGFLMAGENEVECAELSLKLAEEKLEAVSSSLN